jgi:hypothetical protein
LADSVFWFCTVPLIVVIIFLVCSTNSKILNVAKNCQNERLLPLNSRERLNDGPKWKSYKFLWSTVGSTLCKKVFQGKIETVI